ncbi:tyrosine-type recombinase/integrase [Deinococcus knuensis]|uniref:Tyrosine recombinase XerD n=1 Tax=Deinococcus knuensis TaxID=1837380 RepID=A0ABQ2SAV0_9DEIO|nr:tyrosine-type recombinase/integrase [Deinococcus knuensis]GGS15633.1 tyrosine recombinase XerD [Deinococcus knuensis]
MTLEELWEHFYYHLRVKRRAATTLRYYQVTHRTLNRFAAATPDFPAAAEGLTVTHLRAFLIWLEGEGLKVGGVHAHVRAIKALFTWAHQEELLPRNPAARLQRPTLPGQRLPMVNGELVGKLIQQARAEEYPLRDAAMLLTLFDTGVRLAELITLRVEDIHPERGLLRVIGKGDKERAVPVGTRALTAISQYQRRERRPRHAGVKQLFLNRMGDPMTRSCVGIRLNMLAGRLGVARALTTPHTFRRGFAVEFLRNGGDVFTLQQILGHSSLEMTRRYVNFLDEDLKAAHLRFSPGDRL